MPCDWCAQEHEILRLRAERAEANLIARRDIWERWRLSKLGVGVYGHQRQAIIDMWRVLAMEFEGAKVGEPCHDL